MDAQENDPKSLPVNLGFAGGVLHLFIGGVCPSGANIVANGWPNTRPGGITHFRAPSAAT
jgi:hypothetical protein